MGVALAMPCSLIFWVWQEGKAEQELLVDVGGSGGGSGKGHTWDNWDDDWEKVDAQ